MLLVSMNFSFPVRRGDRKGQVAGMPRTILLNKLQKALFHWVGITAFQCHDIPEQFSNSKSIADAVLQQHSVQTFFLLAQPLQIDFPHFGFFDSVQKRFPSSASRGKVLDETVREENPVLFSTERMMFGALILGAWLVVVQAVLIPPTLELPSVAFKCYDRLAAAGAPSSAHTAFSQLTASSYLDHISIPAYRDISERHLSNVFFKQPLCDFAGYLSVSHKTMAETRVWWQECQSAREHANAHCIVEFLHPRTNADDQRSGDQWISDRSTRHCGSIG